MTMESGRLRASVVQASQPNKGEIMMSIHELDGKEYEYMERIPGTCVVAEINKVGGGTLGKLYSGLWEYRMTTEDGHVLSMGDDLYIPIAVPHSKAAKVAWAFLEWESDE